VRAQLEGERVLHPGESTVVRAEIAPAAKVLPQALLQPEAVAPRSECGEAIDCLTRTSKGSSLAAQLALFDLALAARRAHDDDRAVAIWREYLDRFPDGALAPEVSGALVRALVTKAPEQALREAERYHERFGSEPSAGGVELLRAHLLRDVAGRFDEGCALYRALEAQPSLAVRSEALFQTAMCLKARGDLAGAQAALDELKRLAPDSERVRQ
jgi:TolA-binding protein